MAMITVTVTTITTAIRHIVMTDGALYRLMTWLSPSYPVGAFSYSHGLEWIVEAGDVKNRLNLVAWISDLLAFGGGRNDAIFFAHSHRAAKAGDHDALQTINALAMAMAASRERRLETVAQGTAFSTITRTAWKSLALERLAADSEEIAYPVAVGVTAADHGVALEMALSAYVHAFVANLISAGVRLIPLGHTDGQICTKEMEAAVAATVSMGLSAALDDLGGAAVLSDIASMKHETQYTRLFRS